MTKSKDIKNSSYASIELNELLSNYNHDRNQQIILTRNFNEIDTPHTLEQGGGFVVGNPHKLYNKNLKLGFHKKENKISSICPTCNEFFPIDNSLHKCEEKALYNKILESGTCENGFKYKSKIETSHGTIYFEGEPDIVFYKEVSPAQSMGGTEAL